MAIRTNLLKEMLEEDLHHMPEEKKGSDPKFRQIFESLKKGDVEKAKKLSDLMAEDKSVIIG